MFLESMWMKGVLMLSCFILAGMIPLAVLISRDRLRRYRRRRLIPLSQVDQYLGLAGRIRNGARFGFFGRS